MPSFRVNISTKHKGMIFNAAASKAAARRAVIRSNEALAQEGYNRIMQRLGKVLQNPTGVYESRIQIERREIFRGLTDGGIVYGGYLEGVAKNNKTTRFKGYWTFRTVRQSLAKDKEQIMAPFVRELVKELNS